MSDLRDLYQEVILDHAKSPRNFGSGSDEHRKALGHNPLCGDKLLLSVRVEDDRVSDLQFNGEGCAISKASASLMTEAIKGLTVEEAEALRGSFLELVTGQSLDAATGAKLAGAEAALGKLKVFAGVAEYPARVKCASLAWHVLHATLSGASDTVTTE